MFTKRGEGPEPDLAIAYCRPSVVQQQLPRAGLGDKWTFRPSRFVRISGRYPLVLLRDHLQKLVEAAVERLVEASALPPSVRQVPIEISDSRQPDHGDFACNLAMVAAKPSGMNPRQIAEPLRAELAADLDTFTSVDVAGPGFINLRLQPSAIARYLPKVLEGPMAGAATGPRERINVEYVSVNPNGPITVGSGRGAAFGDTLTRVLEAAGQVIDREYYVNDGVNSEQMKLFAESVRALALGNPVPERGYKGEYVADIAERLLNPDTGALVAIDESLGAALNALEHHLNDETSVGFRSERLLNLRSTLLGARDQLRAEIEARDFGQAASEAAESVALQSEAKDNLREVVRGMSTTQIQRAVQDWMIDRHRADLELFGVRYDTWFSEQTLHDSGKVREAAQMLEETGNAYWAVRPRDFGQIQNVPPGTPAHPLLADDEEESAAGSGQPALWIASHTGGFGDDKDRVLIRSDGRPAYIAGDVAYLDNKLRDRDYDRALLILGPDHHGYIGRLYAMYRVLGFPLRADGKPARFEIVIFQVVRFVKNGKPAPMRKRDGNIYELRDLIDELGKSQAPDAPLDEQRRIGADVARFFYLMRSHDTHLDFDIDLATKQSDENPVFYVQYAHARICSVLRRAAEAGFKEGGEFSPGRLEHPRELALIKKIMDLPSEVQRCARDYGVHRLATYAIELARMYHHFYDACRIVQVDEPDLTHARLAVCHATRETLRSALDLLGVSAPEQMTR